MVQRFEVIGVHTQLGKDIRMYVSKRLANLDRYIPRHGRDSAHLEVRLQEEKAGGKRQAVCEATLYLPRRKISLTEHGPTMNAAVDVVKTHLKQQIQKYKDEFASGKQRRHVFARFQHHLSVRVPATNN